MTRPAEEIEVGRRSLLAQLKQALRRADLEEYPVDVATMRDLIEVLAAVRPTSRDMVATFVAAIDAVQIGAGSGHYKHGRATMRDDAISAIQDLVN